MFRYASSIAKNMHIVHSPTITGGMSNSVTCPCSAKYAIMNTSTIETMHKSHKSNEPTVVAIVLSLSSFAHRPSVLVSPNSYLAAGLGKLESLLMFYLQQRPNNLIDYKSICHFFLLFSMFDFIKSRAIVFVPMYRSWSV